MTGELAVDAIVFHTDGIILAEASSRSGHGDPWFSGRQSLAFLASASSSALPAPVNHEASTKAQQGPRGRLRHDAHDPRGTEPARIPIQAAPEICGEGEGARVEARRGAIEDREARPLQRRETIDQHQVQSASGGEDALHVEPIVHSRAGAAEFHEQRGSGIHRETVRQRDLTGAVAGRECASTHYDDIAADAATAAEKSPALHRGRAGDGAIHQELSPADRGEAGVGIRRAEHEASAATLREPPGATDRTGEAQSPAAIDDQRSVICDISDDRSRRAAIADLERAVLHDGAAGVRRSTGIDCRASAAAREKTPASNGAAVAPAVVEIQRRPRSEVHVRAGERARLDLQHPAFDQSSAEVSLRPGLAKISKTERANLQPSGWPLRPNSLLRYCCLIPKSRSADYTLRVQPYGVKQGKQIVFSMQ